MPSNGVVNGKRDECGFIARGELDIIITAIIAHEEECATPPSQRGFSLAWWPCGAVAIGSAGVVVGANVNAVHGARYANVAGNAHVADQC